MVKLFCDVPIKRKGELSGDILGGLKCKRGKGTGKSFLGHFQQHSYNFSIFFLLLFVPFKVEFASSADTADNFLSFLRRKKKTLKRGRFYRHWCPTFSH